MFSPDDGVDSCSIFNKCLRLESVTLFLYLATSLGMSFQNGDEIAESHKAKSILAIFSSAKPKLNLFIPALSRSQSYFSGIISFMVYC